MLKNLKLGAKFNLILVLVFVLGVFASGVTLSSVLQRRAQEEVTAQALTLMEAMVAVRAYTSSHVNPLLRPQLETESSFIPETVPAYAATEVFENLRKAKGYRDFFYKEATLNPTNLRDKADDFEAELVQRFRSESNLKELADFRSLPSGAFFYIARPLAVKQESCLRCHSTPDAAPQSQLATYGSDRGFGWKLNEIVAAQVISVPADKIISSTRNSLLLLMAIIIVVFSAVLIVFNFLLRRIVIKPIKKIANFAKEASTGNTGVDFEYDSKDEIGMLAASFNRMKSSLQIAMNMLNKPD